MQRHKLVYCSNLAGKNALLLLAIYYVQRLKQDACLYSDVKKHWKICSILYDHASDFCVVLSLILWSEHRNPRITGPKAGGLSH